MRQDKQQFVPEKSAIKARRTISDNRTSIGSQEGEETTITAAIPNLGYDNAASFIVRFYLGDPASPNPQGGSGQAVGTLLQTVRIDRSEMIRPHGGLKFRFYKNTISGYIA